MSSKLSLQKIQKEWHGSLKSYVIGLLASLILTSFSFLLVITKIFAGHTLIYILIALALVQAIVQLLFFLHLGQEDRPRWESLSFCFTVLILLVIILGSLWIMNDLDERVMSDTNMEMSHD